MSNNGGSRLFRQGCPSINIILNIHTKNKKIKNYIIIFFFLGLARGVHKHPSPSHRSAHDAEREQQEASNKVPKISEAIKSKN